MRSGYRLAPRGLQHQRGEGGRTGATAHRAAVPPGALPVCRPARQGAGYQQRAHRQTRARAQGRVRGRHRRHAGGGAAAARGAVRQPDLRPHQPHRQVRRGHRGRVVAGRAGGRRLRAGLRRVLPRPPLPEVGHRRRAARAAQPAELRGQEVHGGQRPRWPGDVLPPRPAGRRAASGRLPPEVRLRTRRAHDLEDADGRAGVRHAT